MSSIDLWADARRSGQHMHPDTKANLSPKTPEPEEPGHFKKYWEKYLMGIGLLLIAYLAYAVLKGKPIKATINSHKVEIERTVSGLMPDGLAEIREQFAVLLDEITLMQKDIFSIKNDYRGRQDAALEQVRAWERVHMKLLHEFYHAPFRGQEQRRICITLGEKSDCTTRDMPIDSSRYEQQQP